MDYILEKMNEVNADGIDFIPISDALFNKEYHLCQVVDSYTKERWIANSGHHCIPKTSYVVWKLVDGKKSYIR